MNFAHMLIEPALSDTLEVWREMSPDLYTPEEWDALAGATHFGHAPEWGVAVYDPHGQVFPPEVVRPFSPVFLGIPFGVA